MKNERYAWYVVFVLSIAGIVSLIDRQIINLLVEPIREDLGLTDTQISLLQGFSIAIFYALLGIPIARAADLYNRKAIISIGIVVWSIATAACGLVRGFGQFFFARMMIGVGEATLAPAGFSIISDYFPKKKVTLPLSVFTAASFLGSGITLIVGGYVIGIVGDYEFIRVPLLGDFRPWQFVFVLASLPALVLLLVMQTIKEPKRKETFPSATAQTDQVKAPPISDLVRFARENWRALSGILIGFPLLASVQFGLGAWVPTFFIRTHGWTAADIGIVYGIFLTVFGYCGVVSGGWAANFLIKRGIEDANLRIGLYASVITIPFIASFPLVGNPILALVLLAPVSFFGTVPFGVGTAAIPILAPNRMRAQMVAVYILLANLIGQGCGPTIIAMLTDFVYGDPSYIRYSIATSGPVLILCASVVIMFALKPFRLKLREALAEEAAAES